MKKIPVKVFLLVPFLSFIIYISFCNLKQGTPRIIIRFDDYGVWCNEDWTEIEEEIIKLHEKYNVKLTYGVIPDSRYPLVRHTLSPQEYPIEMEQYTYNPYPLSADSKRVSILKESTAKGITEVALHGYFHPKGYINTYKNTEFYNISYDYQYQKIRDGKKVLDSLFSTSVTTFIPPHNTYDQLTLDFLQEFGFNCISAKQINFDAPMDIRLDIRYLWFTTADIEEFKKIVKLKHYIKAPTQVLALHHTNFTSDGIIDKDKIDSYEQLLKYIVDNNISNYTFSNFPKNEISNDELYYKVAYQYLLMKYGNILASKFIRLCEFISPLILVLFVLLSFVLFIYSLTFCVLDLLNFKYNSFARKSILIVLAFAFSWLLFSLYNAYSISVYNIYYILFSLKILLQLSLLSVMIAVYEISFKRKTI